MKKKLLFAAALSAAAPLFAEVEVTMPEVRRLGFLPQDKADYRPENKMDIKRRNPFAEAVKKTTSKTSENKTDTEESRIRDYFSKNKVTGIMKLGDKYVATIGRLTLEAGQTVPPLIPGQTQILRVMRVDDKLIELGWVEGTPYDSVTPRKIPIKVDLTPRVEVHLASTEGEGKLAEGKSTYFLDDTGKIYLPPRTDLMPDPSEIADQLPPGSDINPDSALSSEEHSQMNLLEGPPEAVDPLIPVAPPEAMDAPPPAEDAPPAEIPAPAVQDTPAGPPMPVEDEIQADPDLSGPPAAEDGPTPPATPAGPL